MLKIILIVIIFSSNLVASFGNFSTNLPPIYRIDNYELCQRKNYHFCRTEIELLPLSEEYNATGNWSYIEFTKHSHYHYDHSKLFHVICLEDYCQFTPNQQQLVYNLEQYYYQQYKHLGLKAKISTINCEHDEYYAPHLYDWIVLYVMMSYMLCLIGVTYYHYQNKKISRYLLPFSLINNFNKLINSVESDKLKYIQGLRFWTTAFIIHIHTFLSFLIGFTEDTNYMEEFAKTPIKNGLRTLYVFLVQTYFLLSAWFLTYKTLQIFETSPKLNFKRYLSLTFINRYIRINVVQAMGIAIISSSWMFDLFGGPFRHHLTDTEHLTCRKYWWMNLLLINNQYSKPMCYAITWYLSADTQLYVLSMLLLVAAWKFHRSPKTLVTISLIIGILIQTIVSYWYNNDVIYRVGPKFITFQVVPPFQFYTLYSSTFSNLPTYMMGVGFAYIHYKYNKQLEIFQNNVFLSKWELLFLGLPLLTLVMATYENYDRLTAAIISALLKPMYVLGMAIGILGMTHDKNGIIKRVLEWKPFVLFGNVTYSTYISHYSIVFYRIIMLRAPLQVSDWILFTSTIRDVIFSFMLGTCVYLLIELPIIQLQKLLVPKLKSD